MGDQNNDNLIKQEEPYNSTAADNLWLEGKSSSILFQKEDLVIKFEVKEEYYCDFDEVIDSNFQVDDHLKICHSSVIKTNNTNQEELNSVENEYNETLNIFIKNKNPKKLYTCEFCNKNFPRSDTLTRHRRLHTGETPYKCEVCGKSFTHLTSLKSHIRTHTGEVYECEVCNKRFSRKGSLKEHKRIHTGEWSFNECEVCNKRFKRKRALNEHKQIHTGEMPYECEVCNLNFIHKRQLNRHLRNHTDA